jgi:hypothetical protein
MLAAALLGACAEQSGSTPDPMRWGVIDLAVTSSIGAGALFVDRVGVRNPFELAFGCRARPELPPPNVTAGELVLSQGASRAALEVDGERYMGALPTAFDLGQPITASASGSSAVPPFSTTMVMPIEDPRLRVVSASRASGIALAWTAASTGQLSIDVLSPRSGVIQCTFALSDGSATIPADAISTVASTVDLAVSTGAAEHTSAGEFGITFRGSIARAAIRGVTLE